MYYKDFDGMKISALGFGGLRLPTEKGKPNHINRAEAKNVIDMAIASGINYFDTSHNYQNGDSERCLGEVLSKYPRDSYYLATKFYAAYATDIEAVFEEQLKRLQTDYFDFYLFHCLDESTFGSYTDKNRGYLDFLRKQKEAGRIRNIGFSSHASPELLERFLDYDDGFDMAMIQINYLDWSLLNAKHQYELLSEHHIPVWVMEPLKGGRLSTLNNKAADILKGTVPDRSLSSWGFRFLMGLPNVHTILSGMSDIEQVQDNAKNFAVYDPLSSSEKAALKKASEIFLKDIGIPCSACRYCCDTCPVGLDIPLLIRGYNERSISGEVWKVPQLSVTKSASACLQCGVCRSHCPQKIDIPAIIKKISEINH